MKDELINLVGILQKLDDQEVGEGSFFTHTQLEIEQEAERIKRAFIQEVFGLRKERLVELYIQYHQSALVHFIDVVLAKLPAKLAESIHNPSDELSLYETLLRILYLRLEYLLHYIEKHFCKYFNQYSKPPESYRYIVHREINDRLPDIRYRLESKGLNKRLLSIALVYLDRFLTEINEEEITYKKLIYLKVLIDELDSVSESLYTGKQLDQTLVRILIYLNYNSLKFFSYCTRVITTEVQQQETLTLQIEKLSFFLKLVNQQQIKPGFILHEKNKPIQDQLSNWIAEELLYFERRQQLTFNFPLGGDEPVQKDFKLRLNLSVSQLGYFIRAMKETGLIQNNNVLELIRFFATYTQTKQTEAISWDSLRTKYYRVDTSAQEGVKDVVIQLFNYVRR